MGSHSSRLNMNPKEQIPKPEESLEEIVDRTPYRRSTIL